MTYNEILILVPSHSLEDFPTELAEAPAESLLNAFSAAWHPRLLATAGLMPKWRRADEFQTPEAGRLIFLPKPSEDWVSHDSLNNLEAAGSVVLRGLVKRQEYLDAALRPLGEEETAADPELIADFLALGTNWLMTELLTRHMRNISVVDHARLETEAVAGAKAALAGDREAAQKHLRRAFETLLECRERFYPVDSFLLDLCLVAPKQATPDFDRLCDSPTPFSLHVTAEDLAIIGGERPESLTRLQIALKEKRASLVGGDWKETAGPLLSIQHSLWNLERGRNEFQRLVGRAPSVWARRRYGVHPCIPQIVSRSQGAGALHFVIDDGVYPDEEHMKFRWQGCDGSVIDAISRIPLAGDSASSFLRFPQRLAESMDHDHKAGIVFARWPELRTPFLDDLRRGYCYSPVLGTFATFDRFFESTDVPGRLSDYKAGEYLSPFLVQSVARQWSDSMSRYAQEWKRRHRFEALKWCSDIASLLATGTPDVHDAAALRDEIERAEPDAPPEAQVHADAALDVFGVRALDRLRDAVAPGGAGNAGWLVVNPLSFQRKAVISLPVAADSVERETSTPQETIVDLPPCGFAWLPAGAGAMKSSTAAVKQKNPVAEEFAVRNEFFEVLLSEATGGIAQIRTYQRSPNRISQQLAFRFPRERTITIGEGADAETTKSFYSEMRLAETRIVSKGPEAGAVEAIGQIVDQLTGEELSEYRQVTRVRRGRPYVEVEITLTPRRMPEGDPWTNYFGVRWAWKHESVAVSRSMMQSAHPVGDEQRIEAPHFIEIADDAFRTTLLPHGLPFHRRTGPRMLDSLLIVAGESQRKFRFDIAVDVAYPLQAALDVMSPPVLIPAAKAPAVESAWLIHLGTRNVTLLDLSPLAGASPDAPPTPGFTARLLETEGRHRTFDLRCFRTPSAARQRDFTGKTIQTCQISGDAVQVEIAPYEVCDIELTF